jgi:hypothetical protein
MMTILANYRSPSKQLNAHELTGNAAEFKLPASMPTDVSAETVSDAVQTRRSGVRSCNNVGRHKTDLHANRTCVRKTLSV